jgi:hypothetical protein
MRANVGRHTAPSDGHPAKKCHAGIVEHNGDKSFVSIQHHELEEIDHFCHPEYVTDYKLNETLNTMQNFSCQ